MYILYIANRVCFDIMSTTHFILEREVFYMAGTIKYNKLLKLMEQKGLSTYKIRKEKIISESTLQNIRSNGRITTDAIASLCCALNCQPSDILEYVEDKPETDQE